MSKKSVYNQKWKAVSCGVKDCWCRMIVLPSWSKEVDDLEDCVIAGGEVNAKMAKYITKLHNNKLKEKD